MRTRRLIDDRLDRQQSFNFFCNFTGS